MLPVARAVALTARPCNLVALPLLGVVIEKKGIVFDYEI
jgi:hypothetical protein